MKDDSEAAREEIFGSVACVFPFKDEEEVVRRANDTPFGLAGEGILKMTLFSAVLFKGNFKRVQN